MKDDKKNRPILNRKTFNISSAFCVLQRIGNERRVDDAGRFGKKRLQDKQERRVSASDETRRRTLLLQDVITSQEVDNPRDVLFDRFALRVVLAEQRVDNRSFGRFLLQLIDDKSRRLVATDNPVKAAPRDGKEEGRFFAEAKALKKAKRI